MGRSFSRIVLLLTVWCFGVSLVAPRILEGLKDLGTLTSRHQAAPSLREICSKAESAEPEARIKAPPPPTDLPDVAPPVQAPEPAVWVPAATVDQQRHPPLFHLASTLKISRGPPRA